MLDGNNQETGQHSLRRTAPIAADDWRGQSPVSAQCKLRVRRDLH